MFGIKIIRVEQSRDTRSKEKSFCTLFINVATLYRESSRKVTFPVQESSSSSVRSPATFREKRLFPRAKATEETRRYSADGSSVPEAASSAALI